MLASLLAVADTCRMNSRTESSREWRAEQRRLGRVPKLIWPHKEDWEKVKTILDLLKAKRAQRRTKQTQSEPK